MKGIRHHIENVRSKPHHVRKRVTLIAAGTVAGVIGVGWFAGSLASGAFALKNTSIVQSLAQGEPTVATTSSDTSNLAGAAAALQKQKSEPAHIVIVNAPSAKKATSTEPQQTTIPF